MGVRNFRDYDVWQRAMDLCETIYLHSRGFPQEELFGLRAQLRRAAVSVPSNIAEGQGRGHDKEFDHFLRIAYGSLREVETQIEIARRLQYWNDAIARELLALCAEVGKLINGLRKTL